MNGVRTMAEMSEMDLEQRLMAQEFAEDNLHMDKLKPCPFCGRTPIVDDCGEHRYFVRCKCGIEQSHLYHQKCDAIRRWNKRKEQDDGQIN